jgi:hypothetical protein
VIVRSVDLGGIDYHCSLEVIVRAVDLGEIDDHCCLEVIVRSVDLGARSTARTITTKQQ